MTDTTAPLAVTMEMVKRMEYQAEFVDRQDLQVIGGGPLREFAADLRALASLARRCLEPDEETVEAVWAQLKTAMFDCVPMSIERKTDELVAVSAAIAALVNPDGR